MISRKTKYALNALVYLARQYQKGPVLISEIAESERIPRKFLEQILLDLKNNGILQSKKGKGGGYFLRRPPREIIIGKVVRLFDGPLAPVSCVSQTAYHRCGECRDENACGIRAVMKDVRDAMAGILDKTTLEDTLQRATNMEQMKVHNYSI
jgi:Rrf2 family protein